MLRSFEELEENLNTLFKLGGVNDGKVTLISEELEDFSCRGTDKHRFKVVIYIMRVEESCRIILNWGDRSFIILNIKIQHYIDEITREKSILQIWRYNNLPVIEFSLQPNFSLRLPELSVSDRKKEVVFRENEIFDQQSLTELFNSSATTQMDNSIFFQTTNRHGFTLEMTLFPTLHKCYLKLLFDKYQDPVFDVTFIDVQKIECDLTFGSRALKLWGQNREEPIVILFDPNFSLQVPEWIWR